MSREPLWLIALASFLANQAVEYGLDGITSEQIQGTIQLVMAAVSVFLARRRVYSESTVASITGANAH